MKRPDHSEVHPVFHRLHTFVRYGSYGSGKKLIGASAPDEPIALDIIVGRQLADQVISDLFHPDVRDAGVGAGYLWI